MKNGASPENKCELQTQRTLILRTHIAVSGQLDTTPVRGSNIYILRSYVYAIGLKFYSLETEYRRGARKYIARSRGRRDEWPVAPVAEYRDDRKIFRSRKALSLTNASTRFSRSLFPK